MGDAGRIVVAIAALGMLALCVTGAALLARSLGGASALLRPIRGDAARRWHGELGRLALGRLAAVVADGVVSRRHDLRNHPDPGDCAADVAASGGPAAPIRGLATLAETDVADLKQLTFPARGDASGAFRLRTSQGEALVDPSTGSTLTFTPTTAIERIGEWAQFLHTGRGAWVLALALGLTTAAVAGARRDRFRDVAATAQRKAADCPRTRRCGRPTRSFSSAARAARPGASPGRFMPR